MPEKTKEIDWSDPKNWNHPLIAAGFWPEAMLRQVWRLGDTYFREWIRIHQVPYRLIGKERWFHRQSLEHWFREFRPGGDHDYDSRSRSEDFS